MISQHLLGYRNSKNSFWLEQCYGRYRERLGKLANFGNKEEKSRSFSNCTEKIPLENGACGDRISSWSISRGPSDQIEKSDSGILFSLLLSPRNKPSQIRSDGFLPITHNALILVCCDLRLKRRDQSRTREHRSLHGLAFGLRPRERRENFLYDQKRCTS